VIVIQEWWGLVSHIKEVVERFAAAGFVALAPDLLGGRVATTVEEAEAQLAGANPDELAHLTRSSLQTLREMPMTPDGPVGVLGFSMGASMALWVSARVPEDVAATAVFYGAQDIDFAGSRSAYLGHFAETDDYVDEDSVALLEAELHLDELDVTFHRYPGTGHWFFEEDRPEHDADAAALAWERTLAFFRQHLG
jgi:carboxymethylenebutenolidase